jgi:hypothetical protein
MGRDFTGWGAMRQIVQPVQMNVAYVRLIELDDNQHGNSDGQRVRIHSGALTKMTVG